MHKLLFAAVSAVVLGVASYAAISASASDRPPDVEAENWIALGADWGFVVESISAGSALGGRTPTLPEAGPGQPIAVPLSPTALYAEADPRLVPRTLQGFFVVKRDGAWARIAAMPAP
jgi:hypothetical protein